jgi:AcrR family transcriptional regulator
MPRPRQTEEQRGETQRAQRDRIVRALADCIVQRGYGATTIADIAASARTSKSTVYAHFADKEEVFLALYSRAADRVLAVIAGADAEAKAAGLDWRERVRANTQAYLSAMAGGHELTRWLLIETQAVSPRALQLRREVLERYGRLLGRLARELARENPELRVPSRTLLIGAIGGFNELMLRAVESGGTPRLPGLTDAATELLCALLSAGPGSPPGPRR